MRSKVGAGVAAGLAGGVLFGILMQLMSMMGMVAQVVGSDSVLVGWLYHLFNSAVIGALFGLVLGARSVDTRAGIVWGLLYGAFWWVLGAQILMPLLLGMPAFASLRMPPMRMVALGSLMGHLLFGLVLGFGYVKLRQSTPLRGAAPV